MNRSETTPLRFVGLVGSLRRRSYNRALLEALSRRAAEPTTLDVLSLRDLPFYDGDVEAAGVPAPVTALRQSVAQADGLVIATPEYNSGVPGVLKNAIDWLSRPPRPQVLDGKPIAILGATPGRLGTRAAQFQLRQNLTPLNALVMPQPMMLIAGVSQLFDDDLQLVDTDTTRRLDDFLASFVNWVQRLEENS